MDMDLDFNDSNQTATTNITILNGDLYPGSQILLFLGFVVPAVILCSLTIVAIFRAKKINPTVKLVLINIFAAEIYISLSLAITLLGYHVPIPVQHINIINALCNINNFAMIASGFVQLLLTTLYAIMVLVFVKYNIKKLKWQYMMAPVLLIWAISVPVNIPFLTYRIRIPNVFFYRGFCLSDVDDDFEANSTEGLFRVLMFHWVNAVICGGVILVFVLLTLFHVKKNVSSSEGNADVKRAVAKNMVFLALGALASIFISVGVPSIFLFTFAGDEGVAANGVEATRRRLLLTDHFTSILRGLSSIYTPVITIVLLKPAKDALRQCLLPCWRSGKVQPLYDERVVMMVENPTPAVAEVV